METIFDIGMYDAVDTKYYLESGYRVIAVEANPDFVEWATQWCKDEVATGQLICLNKAISPDGEPVKLYLSSWSGGVSSLDSDRKTISSTGNFIEVDGTTLGELFDRYGIPYYLKVDIEGADRLCVLSLTPKQRPEYLSFEVGDDVEELIDHAAAVGYRRFKLINQVSFRELANHGCRYDRVAQRLMQVMGYSHPQLVRRGGPTRRGGRYFQVHHSSGPVPWKSDGKWYSAAALQGRLGEIEATIPRERYYDVHATL